MTLAPPPRPLGLPALWRGRWRARRQAWQARGVAAWTRLSHSENACWRFVPASSARRCAGWR
ncbi:hypothetical protein WJ978_22630 [Achromobacter xylosoxidans]